MAASIEQVKAVEVVHAQRDKAKAIDLRRRQRAEDVDHLEIERLPLTLKVVDGDQVAKAELEKIDQRITELEYELQMLDAALKAQGDVIADAEAKLRDLGKDDRRKEFTKLVKRRAEAVAAIEAAIAAEAKAQRELIDVNTRMLVVNQGPLSFGTLTSVGEVMRSIAKERHRVAPREPTIESPYPALLGAASGVMEAPSKIPKLTEVFAASDQLVLQLIEHPPVTIPEITPEPEAPASVVVPIEPIEEWLAVPDAAPTEKPETFDARNWVIPKRVLSV